VILRIPLGGGSLQSNLASFLVWALVPPDWALFETIFPPRFLGHPRPSVRPMAFFDYLPNSDTATSLFSISFPVLLFRDHNKLVQVPVARQSTLAGKGEALPPSCGVSFSLTPWIQEAPWNFPFRGRRVLFSVFSSGVRGPRSIPI